jgi:hypothetical protein
MVLRSWLDGGHRLIKAPAVIAGVFLITLTAALPLTLALKDAIQGSLGASLAANSAAEGVNYDWWQEFTFTSTSASQGTGLATTFTPSVIGFATTLDSFTSLLDRRTLITPITAALAVYVLAWIFLYGGIIDRYARGRRIGAHGFFSACGVFFFRFLRLGVVAGAVYFFLFVHVHRWLFTAWYMRETRDLAVEHVALYWRLLMYGIFSALLALTAVVFDYAKVRAVVEDRRSMLGALAAAIRFVRRHPARVALLYAVNAALFVLVIGAWALVAPGAGGSGLSMWAAVIAAQCYIAARLVVRLQFIASETALFQRTLAHWGYVAAPIADRPAPAVVDCPPG